MWKRARAWLGPAQRADRVGVLWLVKDDPAGKWFCRCPQGVVDAPYHDGQVWPDGGVGWLFTCVKCNKAFMFARARFIATSLEALAQQRTPRVQRVFSAKAGELRTDVLMAGPEDWLRVARPLAEGLVEGERYVFFDGRVLPARPGPVRFAGLMRDHDLPDLPHLRPDGGSEILGSTEYWRRGARTSGSGPAASAPADREP